MSRPDGSQRVKRSSISTISCAFVLLPLLLLLGLARAEPSVDALARAGRRSFEEGRYEEALAAFEEAYRKEKKPQLLYAMGFCHLELKQPAEALEKFEAYERARRIPEENQENLAQAMARARAMLEQEATTEVVEETTTEVEVPDPVPVPVVPPGARLEVKNQAAPPRKPMHKQWWLWTAVGVVASGAVIGTAIGLSMQTTPTPANVLCMNRWSACD